MKISKSKFKRYSAWFIMFFVFKSLCFASDDVKNIIKIDNKEIVKNDLITINVSNASILDVIELFI